MLVENWSCDWQGKTRNMAVHIDVLASKHHEYGDRASIILLHCNVVALRTPSNRSVERLIQLKQRFERQVGIHSCPE